MSSAWRSWLGSVIASRTRGRPNGRPCAPEGSVRPPRSRVDMRCPVQGREGADRDDLNERVCQQCRTTRSELNVPSARHHAASLHRQAAANNAPWSFRWISETKTRANRFPWQVYQAVPSAMLRCDQPDTKCCGRVCSRSHGK